MFVFLEQYAHHKHSTIIVAEDNKEMINAIQITKDISALILLPQELNSIHFSSLPLENLMAGITSRAVSSAVSCQSLLAESSIWIRLGAGCPWNVFIWHLK